MKTKRICKSTVSLILALIMLVSMCTVAFVNTSAAETDIAETSYSWLTVKFTCPKDWSDLKIYWFGSSNTDCGNYPGTVMTGNEGANEYGEVVYTHSVPSDATHVIFSNNGSPQTVDISLAGHKHGVHFWLDNGENSGKKTVAYNEGTGAAFGGGSSTTGDVYTLHGTMNSWSSETLTKGTDTSGATIYYSNEIKSGTYEFKFQKNGSWIEADEKTSNRYDTALAVTRSGSNYKVVATSSFYIVYTVTDSGNAASCVTTLPTSGGTEPDPDPDNPFVKDEWTHIAFRDDTGDSIDDNWDTDVYVSLDGGTTKNLMTKTVDKMSGHDMWTYELTTTPASTASIKFYGVSPINKSHIIYTWNAGTYSGCTTGLYVATSTSGGEWGDSSYPYEIPDKKDIKNLSFGIWADIKGNGNAYDAVIARKDSSGNFHLYLPSTVTGTFELYYSFNSLKIGTTNVSNGVSINLAEGTHTLSFKQTEYDSGTKDDKTLTVYKTNDVATLLFQTKRDLFTEKTASLVGNLSDYKDLETKGNVYLYDEDGEWVNDTVTADKDETVLKKIKGRGNSTFEASMKLYGKYAYNFNLDQKVSLVEGATKAKKWSLLANNVDHSMMRNTFIYALADDIGIKYAPNTRLVNVYDNGYYLGAYVIAEKVEYGGSTLMKDMENLDDYHEDIFKKDYDEKLEQTKDTHNGMSYKYSKAKSDAGFTYEFNNNEFKKYNFLLEFEIEERVDNEASWFKSKKGQHIVVKYPEFATQNEMKWIMDMWNEAETAIYANGEEDLNEIKNYIDVDSFAKMYLIQELTKNLDSAATSYYIHNDLDRNKLVASPVWDYDWSMGSYWKDKAVLGGGSSGALDNPEGWFVNNKPIFDGKNGDKNTYNFQAQLAHNDAFWDRCKYIWTNQMYSAIDKYVDTDATGSADTGLITSTWKDSFSKTLKMNFARWHASPNGEDWGTKKTNNYKYGFYSFDPGHQNLYSNTTSENWDNTIYYLNDWLTKRRTYMNNNGLNTSSVYGITLNDVVMNSTHNGDSVTISVEIDATQNGTPMADTSKFYALFVDGAKIGEYPVTQNSTVNLVLDPEVKTRVCVVGYVKNSSGAMVDYKQCATEKFTYEAVLPDYKVSLVYSNAKQSEDGSTVTVTPSATVTDGSTPVDINDCTYTIVVNGVEKYKNISFETEPTKTFDLDKGTNSVQVIVYAPDGKTNGGSDVDTFVYSTQQEGETVTFTVRFKSSTSYRYLPQLSVNGKTAEPMKITDDILGTNIYGTQKYAWFELSVSATTGSAITLNFSNQYNTNGAVCTLDYFEAGETYFFGVGNLNNGKEAVNLSMYNTSDENAQKTLNFYQSAANMLMPNVAVADLACTSINGSTYKLGDTDSDDVLTVIDATTTQLALARKTDLSATSTALADYNLDGVATIMDATLVQIYLTQ